MSVDDLISALDYDKAPSFVTPDHFDDDPARAHVLRRARERFGLRGVYALLEKGPEAPAQPMIPVVYVCDSEEAGEEEAREPDKLHRLVWNQNATPFLLVAKEKDVRLYAGFKYDPPEGSAASPPILEGTIDRAVEALRAHKLDARSIDDGLVWRAMGEHVTPGERVDWSLLRSLRELGEELGKNERLDPTIAHALIGKYVYLRYLRDRDILSDRKLEGWGLEAESIFGQHAELGALREVVERLEEWLNGSIFPLDFDAPGAPTESDVRLVASTFKGYKPKSRQMHLGFEAYDFSCIPIETLSNVYELFLHAEKEASEEPRERRGRQLGAYYTPVHLVDFILDELDSKRPLKKEMTVFDPACGSGAFLVQAYRRIIERERAANPKMKLTPKRLADLLTESIFGLDLDLDACRVAHLSLSLTLLDYVRPPDLENSRYRGFHMPDLSQGNIVSVQPPHLLRLRECSADKLGVSELRVDPDLRGTPRGEPRAQGAGRRTPRADCRSRVAPRKKLAELLETAVVRSAVDAAPPEEACRPEARRPARAQGHEPESPAAGPGRRDHRGEAGEVPTLCAEALGR